MIWDIRSDLKPVDYPELATFARALVSSNLTDSGQLGLGSQLQLSSNSVSYRGIVPE